METGVAKPTSGGIASLFARKTEAQRRRSDMRKRLRKKLDKQGVELLAALFGRLESYVRGVDGEGFRIEFKDRRDKIDKLIARSFIRESYEPTIKIYRPTLLALSVIDNVRAEEVLALVDRLLRYFARRYETTRSQVITVKEMSEALAVPQDAIANALATIIESPASGGRSSGPPNGPEWQFMPGSNALDYPSLDSVLAQLAEWAGRSATMPHPLVFDCAPHAGSPRSWIGRHKKLAATIGAGLVAVVGFLGDALDLFSSLAKLLGAD